MNICNNSDQTLFSNEVNVCQVPRKLLKTSAFGLGFQHLPRNLANVNAWETMFDPYMNTYLSVLESLVKLHDKLYLLSHIEDTDARLH